MATVTELGAIPASTITAWAESIKTIAILLGTGITAVASVVGGLIHYNTRITLANTQTTQKNTAVTEAIAPVVALNNTEIDAARTEFLATVKSFNETIMASKAELIAEINKVKIVVAKVNNSTDARLSGLKTVQDAVSKLTIQVDGHTEDFKLIKNLTDELKKRRVQ
jgi:hypothetical protein